MLEVTIKLPQPPARQGKQAQMLMRRDRARYVVCVCVYIELSREAELAAETDSLHRHSGRRTIHHISLWSDEWTYRL